ncbi:UDP-N-acetylmuramoyl-tripeptide--D-alanyl-D-alanine ligase [Paenibacillus athensensis]|uniref:UDP-N-acetylmuramoyl-tripeptide--D-alanyl-D-alanine ligase n=1 Tax=Paenibacillus athensensis TaxID=1967502 RepID=A0A4Y8PUV7_9BACL|nr:UDP-N-acetylmuramoyl-tripeptide--D-alanyl-D-alanine ligase [Paenibacillus athensensis]MCD1261613.1 UDP-N-acetylmuramoyl-tripeptide--D-alanyl-D-alanine ligase [Paenibacillus athensensis]
MISRSLQDIRAMLGEEAVGLAGSEDAAVAIAGVSTDTRTIAAGCLFVPLVGETFDGHAYAAEAAARGAAAALWQDDRPHPPEDLPLIRVRDTLAALQQLARAYRLQLPVKLIGITGSNGKTTTKDLVAAALSGTYRVHKTKGNLNNHIGLPLTLLQLEETTEFAVVEMGMSGYGEIELLSNIALPDIAIITMIGESHMLQLGSREGIARAKAEIAAGLPDGALFIYNGDEPLIEGALAERELPPGLRRLRFGRGPDNDLYPTRIELAAEGTFFAVNAPEYPQLYIPLLGEHNVVNALAAIAVADACGVPPESSAAGLATLQMTSMRIEKLTAPSGLTVLNDAYNASPASMRAALALAGQLTGYGRKFVVLGDMLELGDREDAFHREIGDSLSPDRVDYVFTFGRLGALIAEAAAPAYAPGRVRAFDDKERLAAELAALVRDDDVVLVKGSRGMRLEQVVQALLR